MSVINRGIFAEGGRSNSRRNDFSKIVDYSELDSFSTRYTDGRDSDRMYKKLFSCDVGAGDVRGDRCHGAPGTGLFQPKDSSLDFEAFVDIKSVWKAFPVNV